MNEKELKKYKIIKILNRVLIIITPIILIILTYLIPEEKSMFWGFTVTSLIMGGIISWVIMDFWLSNLTIVHHTVPAAIKKHYQRPSFTLVTIVGALERMMYSTMIFIGAPQGIAVWLAFKVLTRWKYSSEKSDQNESPNKKGRDTLSSALGNIYLIGNLLTLFFGILGGLIWRFDCCNIKSFFPESLDYLRDILNVTLKK